MARFLDTNVLIRYLTQDDPAKAARDVRHRRAVMLAGTVDVSDQTFYSGSEVAVASRERERSVVVKSHFGHSQINVGQENLSFYRDLVGFLGWETILDGGAEGGFFVVRGEHDAKLVFNGHPNEVANDYDGLGTNHFAFSVDAQADVDAMADYLRERGVPLLFETPRHRPEIIAGIGGSAEDTYYQVMFASPDNLLFEVVYTGPKAT